MEYAHRRDKAVVELAAGQTLTWRLPPMTKTGAIAINASHTARPADTDPGAPAQPRFVRGMNHVRDVVGLGTIARDNQRPPINDPLHPPPRDPSIPSGLADELTLTLLSAGKTRQSGRGRVLFEVDEAGDIWALQIARPRDESGETRRYLIEVMYPSVLPLETRRIPAAFFERGIHENLLRDPYITLWLTQHKLATRFRADLAQMYGLDQDEVYHDLPTYVKFPEIRISDLRFSVGGGPPTVPDPAGHPQADVPFFSLRIKTQAYGSRTVELENVGPNIGVELPAETSSEIRLHLVAEGDGWLGGELKVTSSLLDLVDKTVTYPSPSGELKTINVKRELTTLIEAKLRALLYPGTEVINYLDAYLKSYLVGNYPLVHVGWDAQRRDILIKYVGRQQPPVATTSPVWDFSEAAVVTIVGHVTAPADIPRLLDTPGEMPLAPVAPPAVENRQPGALAKIEHIVVLMQENRSFDQILGYLSRDGMLPRGNPNGPREAPQTHVDGLLPGDNDRDVNTHAGVPYRSRHATDLTWRYDLEGPWHGATNVAKQVEDMKGFVTEYASHGIPADELHRIMDYHTDAELPAFGALTREFAICDRWHCSYLGGTLPNRFVSLTGNFGRDAAGNAEPNNPDIVGYTPAETPTFFDHLTANGVAWKLFEHGYGTLRLFRNFTFDETNITNFDHPERGFAALARRGELPPVTFIEPDYIEAPPGNDDHAPANMMAGQRLIAKITSALLDSSHWETTLFIITYDEHGGFYDHVPPATEITTFAPDGTASNIPVPKLALPVSNQLGVRVPAFVISPFIPGAVEGKVNVAKAVFDHTTIPATILRRFCAGKVPVINERVSAIADVGHLLTLDAPRPRAAFATLAREMAEIAASPMARMEREPRVPRIGAIAREDDFHSLLLFASTMSGRSR